MRKIFCRAAAGLLATVVLTGGAMAGDAAKGEKVFAKCKACHTVEKGGAKRVGPNLWAVVGKKAGQSEGFKYSKAMMDAGLTWDDATLDKYLEAPMTMVKGTKMTFPGLKKAEDRADVIAYLKAHGG